MTRVGAESLVVPDAPRVSGSCSPRRPSAAGTRCPSPTRRTATRRRGRVARAVHHHGPGPEIRPPFARRPHGRQRVPDPARELARSRDPRRTRRSGRSPRSAPYRPRPKSRASSYQRWSSQSVGPASLSAVRKSEVARTEAGAAIAQRPSTKSRRAVRPELRGEAGVHRVPRGGATLGKPANLAVGPLDHRACCREVLLPGARHLQPRAVENLGHVRQVVRLAVDRNLQQRPLPERIAEAATPAVAPKRREEVGGVVVVSRLLEQIVERLDEARGEMLPQEHRPGHVDVGSVLAVEQVLDPVREIEVARNDP